MDSELKKAAGAILSIRIRDRLGVGEYVGYAALDAPEQTCRWTRVWPEYNSFYMECTPEMDGPGTGKQVVHWRKESNGAFCGFCGKLIEEVLP